MFSPNPGTATTTTKIFGPAYTVQMVSADDETAPKPSIHFADGVEQGSVVIVSQPKGLYSACWGGLMSTRAQYLGAQGVVIDGCFRDVNEHREMGFPVRTAPIFWPIAADGMLTHSCSYSPAPALSLDPTLLLAAPRSKYLFSLPRRSSRSR